MTLTTWLGLPKPELTRILVGIAPGGALWTADTEDAAAELSVMLVALWRSRFHEPFITLARTTVERKRPQTPQWLRDAIERAHAELDALERKSETR